jgi:hypothetical protein
LKSIEQVDAGNAARHRSWLFSSISLRPSFDPLETLMDVEELFIGRLGLPCCHHLAVFAFAAVVAFPVRVLLFSFTESAVLGSDKSHKKENKWMLATAGVALLVYSESSARRARSFALGRK